MILSFYNKLCLIAIHPLNRIHSVKHLLIVVIRLLVITLQFFKKIKYLGKTILERISIIFLKIISNALE